MDYAKLCREISDLDPKIRFAGVWGLRNSLSPKTGRGRYAMAEYEKIKRITIPLRNDHLLLVTTEVEANHTGIIENILKLVNG